MAILFRPFYATTFSTLYFLLWQTDILVAKPTPQVVTDSEIDFEAHLRAYGYLEKASNTPSLSMTSGNKRVLNQAALKNYQKFMGLEVTGELDEATKLLMARPRCGVADKPKSTTLSLKSHFYPNTNVWNKTELTYRIISFASYDVILRPVQESILDDAFFEWSKYVPLTFQKVCETCSADIVIEFIDDEDDSHSDNGRKVMFFRDDIGHAISPLVAQPAFIHFNKQFDFSESFESDKTRTNLFHVAIHEIGHTLGLDHFEGYTDSVMYPAYPEPYDRSRNDYLTNIDQVIIQKAYGKRKESVVGSCSSWSTQPQQSDNDSESQSLSLGRRGSKAAKIKMNRQSLEHFLIKRREKYNRATQRLTQQDGQETADYESDSETLSMIQVDHLKQSGSVRENQYGEMEANFIDRFNNLYVSDFYNNQVVKYDHTVTEAQKTIVAQSLTVPRGIYVTNNASEMYVVDSKGVHRFKLNVKQRNLGASSLLFCLESSSEIYSIIVDEDDFNTIYLYDTGRRNIQRCRKTPHGWKCETIINLPVGNAGVNEQISMVFDTNGDIIVEGAAKNVILVFKHVKDSCDSTDSSPSTEPPPTKRTSSTTQALPTTRSRSSSTATLPDEEDPISDGSCSATRRCYIKDACCSMHGFCGKEHGHCGVGCMNGPCWPKKEA